MARGAEAKSAITNKILEHFEGSFINDKEIRIPYVENGELIEVKVTLTAAKTNVGGAIPLKSSTPATAKTEPASTAEVERLTEPSEEEKQTIADLLQKLEIDMDKAGHYA